MTYTKIYVIECRARNHFYVGTTYRELYDRIEEHEKRRGSIWTTRHGYKRMALWADVLTEHAGVLEDELTEWLMHRYGIRNVRGGNYVNCRADCYANDWWLPKSLRSGFGDVSGLHYCPVSKFPLEFKRLVDTFEIFCSLQNPDHLDSKTFPEPALGSVPEEQEHVLPLEFVASPLGAEQEPVARVAPDHGQK